MGFTSFYFLFLFLPIFLILYLLAAPKHRNIIGVAAGFVFFAWGQVVYLPLMVILILVNFFLSKQIEVHRGQNIAQIALIGGVSFNLLILAFFKTLTAYGTSWMVDWFPQQAVSVLEENLLPLGLSYIVFQLISYLIDIYNELCNREKNLVDFTFYVMMFPKIISGPIVRYRTVSEALAQRPIDGMMAANGIRRFIRGLAKKVLIADTIGRTIAPAFNLETPNFSTPLAWFILIGYSLQLFFDFSGYTDMAIGLGETMGFRFAENFNYPYISKSIADFWRRWHITLSSWFRDYVFLPLEFSLRRVKKFRQQINITIVFLLTGLWHGLTLNFILWGAIHGLAMALELTGFGRWLKKTWPPLQHLYALIVIMAGWVFFRSPNVPYAIQFFARLGGSQEGISLLPYSVTRPLPIIDNSVWLAMAVGIMLSLPIAPAILQWWNHWSKDKQFVQIVSRLACDLALLGLFVVVVASIASSTKIASIYGGF